MSFIDLLVVDAYGSTLHFNSESSDPNFCNKVEAVGSFNLENFILTFPTETMGPFLLA